jgi:hypothetical protein
MMQNLRYSFVLIFILSFFRGECQINENIQSWTNHSSYGNYTQVISAGTVTMTQCIVANAASATGTCTAGRIQMNSSTGIVELPTLNSVGTVEVHLAAGAAGRTLKLQYFDGSIWQDLTTFTGIGTIGATYTFVYNTNNSTTLRLSSPSAALYVHDIIVTLYTGPSITVSTTSLTSLNYNLGAGPSAEQSFTISGSSLTNDIILTPPADYEISTTSGSGFISNPSTIILTQSGGTVASTTIYVRLKAGLSAGNYNSENISCTSIGATTKNVSCSGTVFTPTLTVSTTTLTGFTYIVTTGPSANQTFTISGTYLTSNVSLSAPTDYEISTSSGSGFGSSLTLTPTSGTLSSTTIYVRLKSGLPIGTYNSEVINCTATNATTKTITCNGTVTASNSSDVISVSGSESASVSSIINTSGPLTSIQGTQVWQFTIRDGGASGDADNLPTIVTGIIISNLNSSGLDWSTSIESIDLFDGSTNVGSLQYGNANLTNSQANFTGLNIVVPDNNSKTITVRLTVRCPLGSGNDDGDYFRFSISNTNFTTASSATSSQKSSFTAASSSGTAPRNEIQVVATQLIFSQQPTSTPVNSTMTPNVTVSATDFCGNIDKGFSGTVSLTSTGTMTGSPLTVTASSGVATFSGIVHTVVGTGLTMTASSTGLTSITSSTYDIYLSTAFQPGDFAVISVCSNTNCQGDANGDDQISFMIFKDIQPGDVFIITDNGYERTTAGKWGNSEGTYQVTRTTSTIPAGTVITIKLHNSTPYFEGISPDNNWTFANIGWTGTTCVLNSGGDQLYFMQGGSWNKGTSSGSHDATYTPGVYLYAFNTNNSWTSFINSTQQSGLVDFMECFNMMPGVATDYIEYTGPTTPATKRDWILRLNTSSNWSTRTDCATYFTYNIHQGQTYSILPSSYSDGIWVGNKSVNWFDCANWQNLEIPDKYINVQIPSTGVTNEPTIGAPPSGISGAECNNIEIQTGRTLTMNNAASRLDIYGNVIQNGTFTATNGVVNILDDNSSLTSSSDVTFYNLTLNKTLNTNTFTINSNININNTLTLTSGILTTGTNRVVENNASLSSIAGYGTNSYINGNLRRYVSSTGLYYLPVGTANYYEQASINLNSSSGLSYLDAKFTTPHVSSIDITPLNISINGSILNELLDYGFWTITPSGGTYNYDVSLTSRGHTNAGATAAAHAVIKRQNSTVDWVSEGTHNNADQSMGSGWVTAQRKNLTAFSDFAIAKSVVGPLPVELIDFKAEKKDNNTYLTWHTASEINCNYYLIERSTSDMDHFTAIGTVFSKGFSSELTTYKFVDYDTPNEINYYKLIEFDFDGYRDELGVVAVNSSNKDGMLSVSIIQSNDSKIYFDVYNISGNRLWVELTDLNGNILTEQQFEISEPIVYRLSINVNKGFYLLKVSDSKNLVVKKLIR